MNVDDIASSNGYFPIIGLFEPGEEVCLKMSMYCHFFTIGGARNDSLRLPTGCHPLPEEDMMLVDGGEDEWLRLHDIRYA